MPYKKIHVVLKKGVMPGLFCSRASTSPNLGRDSARLDIWTDATAEYPAEPKQHPLQSLPPLP